MLQAQKNYPNETYDEVSSIKFDLKEQRNSKSLQSVENIIIDDLKSDDLKGSNLRSTKHNKKKMIKLKKEMLKKKKRK